MITVYAIAAGLTALLGQPSFDDVEVQKALLQEAGVAPQASTRTVQADIRLDRRITKKFQASPMGDVLAWLGKEGVSFVVRDDEVAKSKLTVNFENTRLRDAVDAIGDAFGGRWQRRGDVYVFMHGGDSFGGAKIADVPGMSFSTTVPGVAIPPMEGFAPLPAKEREALLRSLQDLAIVAPSVPGQEMPKIVEGFPLAQGHELSEMDRKELHEQLAKVRVGTDALKSQLRSKMKGKKWDEMSLEDRAKFERDMEKWGEEFGKNFGESFGKDFAIQIPKFDASHFQGMKQFNGKDWDDMTPEERAKFEKEMAKFHSQMQKFSAEMGKQFGKGGQFKMDMPRMDAFREFHGKRADGKGMRKMSPQERAQFEKEMEKMGEHMEKAFGHFEFFAAPGKPGEGHIFVAPGHPGQGRAYAVPRGDHNWVIQRDGDGPEVYVFTEGGKDVKVQRAPGKDIKIHRVPGKDMKVRVVPGVPLAPKAPHAPVDSLTIPVDPRWDTPEPRFVMTDTNIKKLMGSLTPSQKELQRKRGYLKASDLSQTQRKWLGDFAGSGDWSITYVVDGQKLSIKGRG